jgi:hypothetical protein
LLLIVNFCERALTTPVLRGPRRIVFKIARSFS